LPIRGCSELFRLDESRPRFFERDRHETPPLTVHVVPRPGRWSLPLSCTVNCPFRPEPPPPFQGAGAIKAILPWPAIQRLLVIVAPARHDLRRRPRVRARRSRRKPSAPITQQLEVVIAAFLLREAAHAPWAGRGLIQRNPTWITATTSTPVCACPVACCCTSLSWVCRRPQNFLIRWWPQYHRRSDQLDGHRARTTEKPETTGRWPSGIVRCRSAQDAPMASVLQQRSKRMEALPAPSFPWHRQAGHAAIVSTTGNPDATWCVCAAAKAAATITVSRAAAAQPGHPSRPGRLG